MKLSKEDIALLRRLEDTGGGPAPTLDAALAGESGLPDGHQTTAPPILDAPRLMFEFNLVNRLASGTLQLTKTGARALFQAECIGALEMAAAGAAPDMAGGVERWLVSSGFLHAGDRSVTQRGKLWLASLAPDPALHPAPHQDLAEGFSARRGAASNVPS